MSVDAAAFRKGMRHLAASVTLITTRHRDVRGGLTATAVCSVSVDPPQILVCVNKTASAHDPIGEAGFFCVNILAPDHRKIAEGTHTIYIGEIVDITLDSTAHALLYGDGVFVHGELLKKALQAA